MHVWCLVRLISTDEAISAAVSAVVMNRNAQLVLARCSFCTISAHTLDDREFALLRLDANKTLVRTLVDELASKYPCSPLAMCLVLPSGAFIDVLGTASKLLAAALV